MALFRFQTTSTFLAYAVLAILTTYATPHISYGQDLNSGSEQGLVNRYAPPGSSTIQVYIWGSVGSSGIWRIEPSLDLIELLSAAGVTGIGQAETGFDQSISLRIYRTIEGTRRMIYEENLENVLSQGASYPSLQDGDVLEVRTQQRRKLLEGIRFITGLVGSAASLALLYLRITQGR